ncbi:MAG TPA: hypothetical protein VF246_09200 [Acidimicrobiia bacterium]
MTREAGTSQPTLRRRRRRISASHVLIALAVVLAFVLNILALRDRDARVLVAVTDRPIAAGSVLVSDMVRLAPVDSSFPGLQGLVTQEELEADLGSVVTRSLPEGSPVDRASLTAPDSGAGKRVMSLEVDESRAAGGTLAAGDLVDVIAVVDGSAVFVVSGAEVVSVPERGSGALTGAGYYVVVAVDSDEALALAEAMAAGRIDVVRSTGAPEAVPDGAGS